MTFTARKLFCQYGIIANRKILSYVGYNSVRRLQEKSTTITLVPNKSSKYGPNNYEEDDEKEFMEDQITLHNQNLNKPLFKEQNKSKTKTARDSVKYQIIKRKFFKPTKEENLLTWRAKEQIRYLNKSNPHEWPINALVAAFPVSKFGVSKILKSNLIGITKKREAQHDEVVFRRWKELAETEAEHEANMDVRLNLIMHAAGNKDLPFPEETKSHDDSQSGPTPFSDILTKYTSTNLLTSSAKHSPKHVQTVDPQTLLESYFNQPSTSKYIETDHHPPDEVLTYKSTPNYKSHIDIPSVLKQDKKLFQKNKIVYDKDGEFLYKIP